LTILLFCLFDLSRSCVCPASGGHRQMARKSPAESTLQSPAKTEFRKNATSHPAWKAV